MNLNFFLHYEIDILSIYETKFNKTISDHEVNILYRLWYISAWQNYRRLGRSMLLREKKSITFTVRNDLNRETLENLCLEIQQPRSKPFVVVTWYRPPDSSIGIFNIFRKFNWDSPLGKYWILSNGRPKLWYDCYKIWQWYLQTNEYHWCIWTSTTYNRTKKNNSDVFNLSLIYVIYANRPDKTGCPGDCHVSISDHRMAFAYKKLSINGLTLGHNTLTYRKFCKFNRTNFRNEIASQNWDEINNFSYPNAMWSKWNACFDLLLTSMLHWEECVFASAVPVDCIWAKETNA